MKQVEAIAWIILLQSCDTE